jgi:dihydroorotate dehydrogenase electron transfer subunit
MTVEQTMTSQNWTVRENRLLAGDCGRLLVEADADTTLPPRPGQFYMVRLGHGTDPLLRRPISVCTMRVGINQPGGSPMTRISFLYKVVGKGTAIMARLQPGEEVDCLGPIGEGFTIPGPAAEPRFRRPKLAVIVAGGIGVAPFPMLVDALQRAEVPVRLYFGGRGEQDLVELDSFVSRGVDTVLTTEDGSCGEQGYVTAPLARDIQQMPAGKTVVYACGPNPMMSAVVDICRQNRLPVEISLETRMGCGLGVCLGCVVPAAQPAPDGSPVYSRVCTEGPVFNGEEVDLGLFQ